MPINYSTAVKNARLQVVIDALGTGGTLVIGTSALAGAATGRLAVLPLDNPSFTINNGVMTMANPPRSANAIASGTAARAELRAADGTVVISGLTVGTSGTDVIINATAISTGQTVQATMGTITHP